MVFCRGFIYETRFVNGSDESDRYNIGVFHQSPRMIIRIFINGIICNEILKLGEKSECQG